MPKLPSADMPVRVLKFVTIGLLAVLSAACTGLPFNAKAPKVSVAEVSVKRLGLFEQVFDVGLRVNNPNDFDINIEGLEFKLEINGREFATGVAHTHTRLPAFSSAVVRVDTTTDSNKLLQQIKTLPELMQDGVPYRIQGRIKIDRVDDWWPFDHSGAYGGDKKKKDKGTVI